MVSHGIRTAVHDGSRVILRFPFDRPVQHDLKERLGARWNPDDSCWWIPAPHGAPAAAVTADVLKEHGFSGVDDAICAPSSAQREITESFFCDIAEQLGGDVEPDLTLRPYQIDGVRALVNSRRMLLADQPGLGKTYQSIAAVIANGSLPTLVTGLISGVSREVDAVRGGADTPPRCR